MYRLLLVSVIVALAACAGPTAMVPQSGSLHGLVNAQRALDRRIPGGYSAVIEAVGIARSGDVGYTFGHWSLRVDNLPQFRDARGSFLNAWIFEQGRWRPVAGGRVADLTVQMGTPQWSGVNDAAATVSSTQGAPPNDADAAVHTHGMQVSLAGDVAVQWGEELLDDGTRRDWVRAWHHTADGWQLRSSWAGTTH